MLLNLARRSSLVSQGGLAERDAAAYLEGLRPQERWDLAHSASRLGRAVSVDLSDLELDDALEILGEAPAVAFLYLSRNRLASVYSCPSLASLLKLDLRGNRLRDLGEVAYWRLTPNLRFLYLGDNEVSDPAELEKLSPLRNLVLLDMRGNPCCSAGEEEAMGFPRSESWSTGSAGSGDRGSLRSYSFDDRPEAALPESEFAGAREIPGARSYRQVALHSLPSLAVLDGHVVSEFERSFGFRPSAYFWEQSVYEYDSMAVPGGALDDSRRSAELEAVSSLLSLDLRRAQSAFAIDATNARSMGRDLRCILSRCAASCPVLVIQSFARSFLARRWAFSYRRDLLRACLAIQSVYRSYAARARIPVSVLALCREKRLAAIRIQRAFRRAREEKVYLIGYIARHKLAWAAAQLQRAFRRRLSHLLREREKTLEADYSVIHLYVGKTHDSMASLQQILTEYAEAVLMDARLNLQHLPTISESDFAVANPIEVYPTLIQFLRLSRLDYSANQVPFRFLLRQRSVHRAEYVSRVSCQCAATGADGPVIRQRNALFSRILSPRTSALKNSTRRKAARALNQLSMRQLQHYVAHSGCDQTAEQDGLKITGIFGGTREIRPARLPPAFRTLASSSSRSSSPPGGSVAPQAAKLIADPQSPLSTRMGKIFDAQGTRNVFLVSAVIRPRPVTCLLRYALRRFYGQEVPDSPECREQYTVGKLFFERFLSPALKLETQLLFTTGRFSLNAPFHSYKATLQEPRSVIIFLRPSVAVETAAAVSIQAAFRAALSTRAAIRDVIQRTGMQSISQNTLCGDLSDFPQQAGRQRQSPCIHFLLCASRAAQLIQRAWRAVRGRLRALAIARVRETFCGALTYGYCFMSSAILKALLQNTEEIPVPGYCGVERHFSVIGPVTKRAVSFLVGQPADGQDGGKLSGVPGLDTRRYFVCYPPDADAAAGTIPTGGKYAFPGNSRRVLYQLTGGPTVSSRLLGSRRLFRWYLSCLPRSVAADFEYCQKITDNAYYAQKDLDVCGLLMSLTLPGQAGPDGVSDSGGEEGEEAPQASSASHMPSDSSDALAPGAPRAALDTPQRTKFLAVIRAMSSLSDAGGRGGFVGESGCGTAVVPPDASQAGRAKSVSVVFRDVSVVPASADEAFLSPLERDFPYTPPGEFLTRASGLVRLSPAPGTSEVDFAVKMASLELWYCNPFRYSYVTSSFRAAVGSFLHTPSIVVPVLQLQKLLAAVTIQRLARGFRVRSELGCAIRRPISSFQFGKTAGVAREAHVVSFLRAREGLPRGGAGARLAPSRGEAAFQIPLSPLRAASPPTFSANGGTRSAGGLQPGKAQRALVPPGRVGSALAREEAQRSKRSARPGQPGRSEGGVVVRPLGAPGEQGNLRAETRARVQAGPRQASSSLEARPPPLQPRETAGASTLVEDRRPASKAPLAPPDVIRATFRRKVALAAAEFARERAAAEIRFRRDAVRAFTGGAAAKERQEKKRQAHSLLSSVRYLESVPRGAVGIKDRVRLAGIVPMDAYIPQNLLETVRTEILPPISEDRPLTSAEESLGAAEHGGAGDALETPASTLVDKSAAEAACNPAEARAGRALVRMVVPPEDQRYARTQVARQLAKERLSRAIDAKAQQALRRAQERRRESELLLAEREARRCYAEEYAAGKQEEVLAATEKASKSRRGRAVAGALLGRVRNPLARELSFTY